MVRFCPPRQPVQPQQWWHRRRRRRLCAVPLLAMVGARALAASLLLVLALARAAEPAFGTSGDEVAANVTASGASSSGSGASSSGAASEALAKLSETFRQLYPWPPPDGVPRNACVAARELPYAYCAANASSGAVPLQDPSQAAGVEVEALKRLFGGGYLGGEPWTYGTDWQFLCMSWDDLVADLTSAQPMCMVAAAGMSATEEALLAGIGFSDFPSSCAGVAVLTRARVQQSSIWFFLQPLEWQVWVLWLGLAGGLVLLMFLAEMSAAGDSNQYGGGWPGFGDSAFVTATMSFTRAGTNRFDHSTLAARLLGLFAAFFFMIFFTIYTAQLAGRLAAESVQSSVTGFASLRTGEFAVAYPRNLAWAAIAANIPGTPVDKWEDRAVRDALLWLMDNAAQPSGPPPPHVQAALDSGAVSRHVPDALLLLESQARMAALQYCNLFMVGEQIKTTKQALAFPAAAPNITRTLFSIAETRLQEKEAFFDASQATAYLLTLNVSDFHPARCPGKLPVSSAIAAMSSSGSQDKINVHQMLGLLVVLGVGMAAACLLILWSCRSRRKRDWHRAKARAMLLPLAACCGRQGAKTAPAPAPAHTDP